jgi:general secretion pathway protein J
MRPSRIPSARTRGFSLIELLVALVIFATMAAIAYAGLGSITRARAALDEREGLYEALGRTLALIERDLRAVAVRPTRNSDGAMLPALFGQSDALELSVFGPGRRLGADLGLVERIGYLRNEDGVQRLRWPVLDRTPSTQPDRRVLLPAVERLRWRYLASDGRWHDRWPLPGSPPESLPVAIECTFLHPSLGEIRRLIELPAGLQP